MIRRLLIAVGVILLGAASAWACRFNVRDVGFVDLGSNPYTFYCVVSQDTPQATITSIKQIATAAFLNVNIEPKIVELAESTDAALVEHYKKAGEPKMPVGILVSEDGERQLVVPLFKPDESPDESLWSAMESTFESPVRDQVTEKAIAHYGVILLIEGTDDAENQRAKGYANAVTKRIEGAMDKLEKPIDKPPVVVALSKSEAITDRVFLWSLGIDANAEGASIVVLYGRGRTIGSVLQGKDISEQKIFQVVATIGLNCECGLDRSWMQGKMIPMKWGSSLQTQIAEVLGFDAEDPKIKMEISQILSKAGSGEGRRRAGEGQDLDTFLANYEETTVEDPSTESQSVEASPSVIDEEQQRPNRIVGPIVLSVIGVIVLAFGSLIALRGRSRNT
ncbi:MAG: hypothetical protein ACI9R3_000628 [Verrucomicrobiales bacterium]|jgi:hypothetical protein